MTLGRYARRPPTAMPAGDGLYCLGPANRAQRMRQAEISARPLRRRAARMARPARVRMRSRKPWVFARRRLFGWKVRLLTSGLQAQDASPAHGDARQWLACRMRGMRNSRRVASRPSYVTGQTCPRSNRRVFPEHALTGYPRFHRHVIHRRLAVHRMCAPSLPYATRLWTTSCTQLWTGLLSALPDPLSAARTRRTAGNGLCTACGFDVDFVWRPRRGHGTPCMWTTTRSGAPGGHHCG